MNESSVPDTLTPAYAALVREIVSHCFGPEATPGDAEIEKSLRARMAAEAEPVPVRRAANRETAARILARATAAGPRKPADPEKARLLEEKLGGLSPERERAVRAHLSGFEVSDLMNLYGWSYQDAWNLLARGMATLRKAGLPGTDQELRALYGLKVPADHPDEKTWEDLAADELSELDRNRTLDHVTRCTSCTQIYRGLVELEEKARSFDPGYPEVLVPRQDRLVRSRGHGVAAAAAFFALIAVTAFVWITFRGMEIGAAPTLAESRIVPIEPLGRLPAEPKQLSWEPVDGADSYQITLYSEFGDVIWESQPTGIASIRWPRNLELGAGRYFWRVEALAHNKPVAYSTPILIAVPGAHH